MGMEGRVYSVSNSDWPLAAAAPVREKRIIIIWFTLLSTLLFIRNKRGNMITKELQVGKYSSEDSLESLKTRGICFVCCLCPCFSWNRMIYYDFGFDNDNRGIRRQNSAWIRSAVL